jgi:hypothetical protein
MKGKETQPETIGSLMKKYNLDRKTFEKILTPIMWKLKHKVEHRYILLPKEVEAIIELMEGKDLSKQTNERSVNGR